MSSPAWGLQGSQPPTAISRRSLLRFRFADEQPAPRRRADHWVRVHRTAMACRFEVVLPGQNAHAVGAATAALDEADRLEALLTVFRDTSEISRLNRVARTGGEAIDVDPAVVGLLHRCRALHAATGGAFDITSTPLSRCWGFLKREGRLPSPEAIAEARSQVGMDRVRFHEAEPERRISFAPPVELNLGSIGKGYALDRMGVLLRRRGVEDALLSAGGSSMLAIGDDGGEGWPIDLRPRRVARSRVARVRLRNAALATSGAGEQFVEVDGVRYGHVIDPRTGWPASGVLSASVITCDAATADALSTAFLVGGADLAAAYCEGHAGTLALLVLDDGRGELRRFGHHAGADIEELTADEGTEEGERHDTVVERQREFEQGYD